MARLMIVVAVVGIVGYGLIRCWDVWADASNIYGGLECRLTRSGPEGRPGVAAGVPRGHRVSYAFGFGPIASPPLGLPLWFEAQVRIWDMDRGVVVDDRSFRRLIVSGLRERDTGAIDWEFAYPRPGSYAFEATGVCLDHRGRVWRQGGGSKFYSIVEDPSGRQAVAGTPNAVR